MGESQLILWTWMAGSSTVVPFDCPFSSPPKFEGFLPSLPSPSVTVQMHLYQNVPQRKKTVEFNVLLVMGGCSLKINCSFAYLID